ncbi:TPA: LPXTG cell wall anchor domain-containing protein [Streptococcus suis]
MKKISTFGVLGVTMVTSAIISTQEVKAEEAISSGVTSEGAANQSNSSDSVQQLIDSKNKEIVSVQSEIDSVNASISSTAEELAIKQSTVTEKMNQIEVQSAELAAIQSKGSEVQEQISAAEQSVANLESKVANLAKNSTVDAEALANAQAEKVATDEAVVAATGEVNSASQAVTKLENELAAAKVQDVANNQEKTKIETEITQTQSELENATSQVANLEKEVSNKLSELQKAVDLAKTQSTTSSVTTEVLEGNNWQEFFENVKNKNNFSPRETFQYSVEGTQGINAVTEIVISEADKKAIQDGTFVYTPNSTEVSKYYAEYINKLRALNGIEAKVLGTNSEVTSIAEKHVKEYVEKSEEWRLLQSGDDRVWGKRAYHYHESVDVPTWTKTWWNNADHFAIPNTNLYYNGSNITDTLRINDKDIVYSDQELAYRILLKEFSEYIEYSNYKTPELIYGHRMYLLLMDTDYVGVAAVRDPQGDIRTTEIFVNDNSDSKGAATSTYMTRYINAGNPGLVSFDASGNFLYNGKRVSFLPATQFSYVTKQTITDSSKLTGAEKALEQYRNESTVALNNANQKVNDLQNQLTQLKASLATVNAYKSQVGQIESALQTAKETLTTKQKSLDGAKLSNKQAIQQLELLLLEQSELSSAIEELNQAKSALSSLKNLLTSLNNQETSLENSIEVAQKLISNLNSEIITLESSKVSLESKLKDLLATISGLNADRQLLLSRLELLKEIERLSVDHTVTSLEDGTIVAVPKNAVSHELGYITLDQFLSEKKNQIISSGNVPVEVKSTTGEVIDYLALSNVSKSTKANVKNPLASNSGVSDNSTKVTVKQLPSTGSAQNFLSLIGLGILSIGVVLKKKHSN